MVWSKSHVCFMPCSSSNMMSSQLEPGELWCISLTKYEIQVVDYEPFKERFWRIPPPLCLRKWGPTWRKCCKQALYTLAKAHGVMLSCWSERRMEAYALLYRLPQVECEDQERFLSITPHTGGHWESCKGGWVFLLFGLESRLLVQITMDKVSKQYTAFTVGKPRIFWVQMYAL